MGLDCYLVVILYDLFAERQAGEVVAIYLDEFGECCVCEACGGR
jgi:hypothetical protein